MSAEPNSSSSTFSHEEISTRARQLWESAGSPAERDLEFWLEAESSLRREGTLRPASPQSEPVAKRSVNRRR